MSGVPAALCRSPAPCAACECRVYREWPITEASDVRRAFPHLSEATDVQAWISYQKACAQCFTADRARLYHDFFNNMGQVALHILTW